MATFTDQPRSFTQAREVYDRRIRKARSGLVRLGNETFLNSRQYPYRHMSITLFGNEIVRFKQDGSIELDTCGWITKSTIDRMDAFTPSSVSIRGVNYHARALVNDPHLLISRRHPGRGPLLPPRKFYRLVTIDPDGFFIKVDES